MDGVRGTFSTVELMLRSHRPAEPVYCLFPRILEDNAAGFVRNFPGRALYAVKANDHPAVIRAIHRGGVRHFDCASLPEVRSVNEHCDGATCYFMTPVRLRGAAAEAQKRFGVRHFLVDHESGVEMLAREVRMESCVVFARMAVSHESAMIDLSNRFGAPPAEMPSIMNSIARTGAEAALAFNVGSSVTSPAGYVHALGLAAQVLESLPFEVRLLDIGGGFPRAYPGFDVPPLESYFTAIRDAMAGLPLAGEATILGEPGRALAAPGMSAVVEVCLRKENRLYINDGMYGIFWELRCQGHDRFPARVFRNGEVLDGETATFRLFGPTCDSSDVLPGEVALPADIRPGDHIEFGCVGAYSLAGRTAFNGFYSDQVVTITDGAPAGFP